MTETKDVCVKCVLHTGIPGIQLNDEGICTVCNNFNKFKQHEPRMRKYLVEEMENSFKAAKNRDRLYHAVVLFSGGKDSTMLLKMAKEKYGLRVLACSVMHPLVNEKAKRNMEEVTNKLNIDLIKIYPDEAIYRKVVQHGIINGTKYGLGEFYGCDVCSFFHHWLPIRYAMKLEIPIILEGSDLSQTGEISYGQSERIREEAKKGKKPFGKIHDLVIDALGENYKGSIYDYDEDEVIAGKYPTIISPFSFIDYDFKETFREIESLGLNSKEFRTIYTNCAATPFFSYFSLKKFDCVSYIKHYATEVRRGYPNLSQYISKDNEDSNSGEFNKETVEKLMDEYKRIVFHIVENNLSDKNISENEIEKMKQMAPTYMGIFGEEVCNIFLNDALQIPYFADYFGVDLHDITRAKPLN